MNLAGDLLSNVFACGLLRLPLAVMGKVKPDANPQKQIQDNM